MTAIPGRLPVAAASLAVLLAGTAAIAAPRPGVHDYNVTVCGKAYVPVDLGHGNYFNVYNQQDHQSCVSSERHHLAWSVASRKNTVSSWQYPNISSGWEWGRYTCYDGPSAYPSAPGSQCMRYPVQARYDGDPVTSVSYWPHLARGNVAYDIWFDKTAKTPVMQNDGAEIMIWLDHPRVGTWSVRWHAVIGGIRYTVMNWTMRHNGAHWDYMAYVAAHYLRTFGPVHLNAFFRDAEKHGQLSPLWYLTAIDFGSEINISQSAGPGFAVTRYTLAGVGMPAVVRKKR